MGSNSSTIKSQEIQQDTTIHPDSQDKKPIPLEIESNENHIDLASQHHENRETITEFESIKRQTTLLDKLKFQDSRQVNSGQSFKAKKFDKEKFKTANQKNKSLENISLPLVETALLDDEDEKLMNSILNKI